MSEEDEKIITQRVDDFQDNTQWFLQFVDQLNREDTSKIL